MCRARAWTPRRACAPRSRTRSRARFNDEFVGGLGLVDVFRAHHPEARAYTCFNRRARGGRLDAARVDFVLADAAIAGAVVDAGIEADPALRTGSDHAPVSVTLSLPRRQ